MPRAKPDQVVVHRIELGQYERDALLNLVGTMEFRNIAEPTVKLLSDQSAMLIVISALELLGITDITDIDDEGILGSILKNVRDGVYDSIADANAALDSAVAGTEASVGRFGLNVALGLNWIYHQVREAGESLQP